MRDDWGDFPAPSLPPVRGVLALFGLGCLANLILYGLIIAAVAVAIRWAISG